ncbi:hypothetical protein [Paraflavitalea soli]|nr:hypothetical protein [Paraflavitalea soli]
MELIQQKSHGPAAALKKAFKKQLLIIPTLVILVGDAVINPSRQTDPFFSLFFGITVLTMVFFAVAYFTLRNMGKTDAPVVDQLKRQLRSLQDMMLFYRIISLAGVLMLVIFLEVFKDLWTGTAVANWYEVGLWLRIPAYGGLLFSAYVVFNRIYQKDYGQHLDELKKSLSETE